MLDQLGVFPAFKVPKQNTRKGIGNNSVKIQWENTWKLNQCFCLFVLGPDFQGTDSREHFVKSWSQKESLPLLNSIVLTECNQSACQQAILLSEGNSKSKHKPIRDAFTANRNNSKVSATPSKKVVQKHMGLISEQPSASSWSVLNQESICPAF